jgi:hypothetical protein
VVAAMLPVGLLGGLESLVFVVVWLLGHEV